MEKERTCIAKQISLDVRDGQFDALDAFDDARLDDYISEHTGSLGYFVLASDEEKIVWVSLDDRIQVLNILNRSDLRLSHSMEMSDWFDRVFVDDNPNLQSVA